MVPSNAVESLVLRGAGKWRRYQGRQPLEPLCHAHLPVQTSTRAVNMLAMGMECCDEESQGRRDGGVQIYLRWMIGFWNFGPDADGARDTSKAARRAHL